MHTLTLELRQSIKNSAKQKGEENESGKSTGEKVEEKQPG
jgi:hypothetical protein